MRFFHLGLRTLPAVMIVLIALSGCDSPTTAADEVFTLSTINGSALPGPSPDSPSLEVTGGTLTLHPEGRMTVETVVRCRSNLPANTSCEVYNGGRSSNEGTYSREEGWVQFGTPRWPGDGRYQAEFAPGSVRITYGLPPSQGFSPRYEFEYRR